MADLVLSGTPGDALELWKGMDYEVPGEGERSLASLTGMLAGAESRRRIEFARATTGRLGPYRDAFQLHQYYGPRVVPGVLGWIRRQMAETGSVQPIIAAEVGYLIPTKPGKSWDGRPINVADMSKYSDVRHGSSLAETIAALAGHGVEDILYWDLRFHVPYPTAASLYVPTTSPDEFQATRATEVFRFVIRELTGSSAVAPTPELGTGAWVEYRFRREGEFSILWRADGGPIAIPPTLDDRIARLADTAGRPISRSAAAAGDAAPIFVYWR
jgi:hypothetical protein